MPDVEIWSEEADLCADDQHFDIAILGKVKGHPVRFLIEVKSSGYPRDIQQSIWKLSEKRQAERTVVDVPIIASPSISESSRELLRRHKMGYWDAGGSLYIDLPWAMYLVDRPVPAGRPRNLRSVYRGSAARVLHALLLDPGMAWHVSELAERAKVSVSTVHQVCTFLEEQLWMEKEGRGPQAVRMLRQPGAVLDAWAAAHSLKKYEAHRFHRWTQKPAELLQIVTRALASLDVEYALTLSSGSQIVAPYGTEGDRIWLLVPASAEGKLDALAAAADLRRVQEGETVTVFAAHERSPLLFRRQVQDLWIASDIQLYLDLSAWPQRGKEQARHLRTERLSY